MRLLFLSSLQIHPTLSGGQLRSFALASALQRHGVEVFVYSLVGRKHDYLERRPSALQTWPGGIREYVDRGPLGFLAQYASYALGLPPLWLTAYLRAACCSRGERLLTPLLRARLAWSDVVLADFPFLHPVFEAPSAKGSLRVLSTHNLEHRLCPDWLGPAVRRIETRAAATSHIVVSCCSGDRDYFESHAPVRRSVVVPNGTDLRRFQGLAAPQRSAARRALGIADDVLLLLFTGSKYGPNREAFEYLASFAASERRLLEERRVHLLVVGGVAQPARLPGLTVTGKVDVVEPYFAAADIALNPIETGAGTNVKVAEFLAARLPIVSTAFGARGFALEHGKTAFLFERAGLGAMLSQVRGLSDAEPERLRQMADLAYAANEGAIDMDAAVRPLVAAMHQALAPDARGAARWQN
jgi:glycosyltransferase involved in cell wall biosynthesis